MSQAETAGSTEHRFQAEVAEVLSLVVHSLYTHKEVFLRELVSNASDAIDHLDFRALTEPALLGAGSAHRIDLVPDRAARTLTISDDGVGMDEEELVRNLGTIAHSGTRRLLESLSGDQRKDLTLIGQFGVGFYAAFLVADRVEVVTRKAGGDGRAFRWASDGRAGFTVEPAEREGRGTDVVLHLKKGEDDFLRDWTLRELVKKYSDFVRHPIRLRTEREEKDGKAVEMEQVNRAAALWTRPRSEIDDEAAADFYRHVTHDWEAPLAWTHFRTEGLQETTGMLFVPRRAAAFDLPVGRRRGVRLFVKRVFIMDDCEELLPEYLRFVRGVLDSDDLPLNVSRELLQRDRLAAGIRRQVVRKVLDLLEQMAAEGPAPAEKPAEKPAGGEDGGTAGIPDRYAHFWRQHGRVLAEGVVTDPDHSERIARLLRFSTSHGEGLTGLADYVARMPAEQKAVYYVVADSRATAERSPHAEALRKRGWEVLFVLDPAEEWTLQNLREFDGRKLVSAVAGDLDLPEDAEAKERREKLEGELAKLVQAVKGALGESVRDVRISTRLTDSPACLVAEEHEGSPQLMRAIRAHGGAFEAPKRVLELNGEHPVVRRMGALADQGEDDRVRDLAALLHDHALVAEGSPPSDPARFAGQVTRLLQASIGA